MSSFFKGLASKVEEGVTRSVDQVQGIINPNHRHDEAHEKEQDEIRAAINRSHRFESFAAERDLNAVKWHIDGHDFFWALSELLDSAKECIFILDWWLSPELYLRRPPAYYPEWRIDKILERKAKEGVKVYVIVYKEVTQTMTMSSHHTKNALEDLHPNIAVMRHPDHVGAVDTVQFWSHHEKLVVVDNHRATVGGLDICFGRWDTHNHPMADAHPTEFKRTLFAGQDYNNSRVKDFQQVDNFASNQLSILETGRMPWHDVSCTLIGTVVLDLVQHFTERWNEVKKRKYKNDKRYDWLALPHDVEAAPNEAVAQHPHREQWHKMGTQFKQRFHIPHQEERQFDGERYFKSPHGTCRVQVCRSVSDWSHGVLPEKSIQSAYIQLIREASHSIYIENQFFISNTGSQDPVTNLIAKAIVERIISAHNSGQKFKITVIIPEVPGFTGDIKETTAIQTIMLAQYRTINRGGHSIFEELRKVGIEPLDYIRFFHLRSYDRINAPYPTFIKKMEENSGVSFHQAQVALARQWIGDVSSGQWHQETIKIASGTTGTTSRGDGGQQSGGSVGFGGPGGFSIAGKLGLGADKKPKKLPKSNDDTDNTEAVPVPASEEESERIVAQFERGADTIRGDDQVSDSVAQHVLGDSTSLLDEKWLGTEDEEKNAFFSEQLYIHTKLMIVDDKRVIIGSANLNDRSQKGNGDSEIAIVVEDTDLIESKMDGKPYMAGRFAATLRRKLWREHLGLIEPQVCESDRDPVTSFMHPAPVPNADESRLDRWVEDPLSAETINLWNQTAKKNTEIFCDVFKPVPTDRVRTWDDYTKYLPKDTSIGHIAKDVSLEEAKRRLAEVRGHLVEMPLGFLEDEKNLTWNPLDPTLPIYI
ncbi:phospholipase D/nuclease [Exidia glandulosa HHB12029]|uniref:Phospholipase n=1 Tax=Exidia glandulosa HHB12029 TaxID=1314781 RepID=A0A165P0J9_EXIGL|nr:phospholipase D/nuclease [Exidia glandulosa HHB12029]